MNSVGGPLTGWTVPRPVFKRLQRLTNPAELPITRTLLKQHLRVTHNDEDDYIDTLISAATDVVEQYLSRALVSRTVRMWMDMLPGLGPNNQWNDSASGVFQTAVAYDDHGMFRWFTLYGAPVTAFASLSYVNEADSVTIIDPATYLADFADPDAHARVILRRGGVWPSDLRVARAIYADYTLGYGAAIDVPAPLKHGVMLVAGALWSNRGDNADPQGDVLSLPAVAAVLAPYRVLSISTL